MPRVAVVLLMVVVVMVVVGYTAAECVLCTAFNADVAAGMSAGSESAEGCFIHLRKRP